MKKWIYALIAVLMLPGMSLALDGNEMLQACKIAIRVNDYNDHNPGNRFGIAKCSYYVAGFKEAVEFNEDWLDERDKNLGYGTYRFLCVPDDVTIMQVIGAFVNYMEQHPEDLNDPAYSILTMTFLEVFPCLKWIQHTNWEKAVEYKSRDIGRLIPLDVFQEDLKDRLQVFTHAYDKLRFFPSLGVDEFGGSPTNVTANEISKWLKSIPIMTCLTCSINFYPGHI